MREQLSEETLAEGRRLLDAVSFGDGHDRWVVDQEWEEREDRAIRRTGGMIGRWAVADHVENEDIAALICWLRNNADALLARLSTEALPGEGEVVVDGKVMRLVDEDSCPACGERLPETVYRLRPLVPSEDRADPSKEALNHDDRQRDERAVNTLADPSEEADGPTNLTARLDGRA